MGSYKTYWLRSFARSGFRHAAGTPRNRLNFHCGLLGLAAVAREKEFPSSAGRAVYSPPSCPALSLPRQPEDILDRLLSFPWERVGERPPHCIRFGDPGFGFRKTLKAQLLPWVKVWGAGLTDLKPGRLSPSVEGGKSPLAWRRTTRFLTSAPFP